MKTMFVVASAIALVVVVSLAYSHLRLEARSAELRDHLRERYAAEIETYYFALGHLPSWEEFREQGFPSLTPGGLDAMNELVGRAVGADDPFGGFQREVFLESLSASKGKVGRWKEDADRSREKLRAHDGDLEKQLDLLAAPEFDARVALPLIEELISRHGVSEEALSALLEAIPAFGGLKPSATPDEETYREAFRLFRQRKDVVLQQVRNAAEERDGS